MQAAPDAQLALSLAAEYSRNGGLAFAAHGEGQAARILAALRVLAPDVPVLDLPAWDCLPFDHAGPSHAVMGRRMRALHHLASEREVLLVASVAALMQRLPPPEAWRAVAVAVGDAVDPAGLEAALARLGYQSVEATAAPGEIAPRAEVIDIFPAAATSPVRLRLEAAEGTARVAAIDRFDPRSQRARATLAHVAIGPASEIVADDGSSEAAPRPAAIEHALPEHYPSLVHPLDLPGAGRLLVDAEADERMASLLEQIEEARATRLALLRAAGGVPPPSGLYIDQAFWDAARARAGGAVLDPEPAEALPAFSGRPDPVEAARHFVAAALRDGRRVGLSGRRLARTLGRGAAQVSGWAGLLAAPAGAVALLPPGLEGGFVRPEAVVLADADLFGTASRAGDPASLFSVALRPGDAVIHLDHGIARLDGIETVTSATPQDCLVLGFAGAERKLVPCTEMGRIWRYGAASEGVTLDRASGTTWPRRRATVQAAIDETARALAAQAQARRATAAPVLSAPRRPLQRFVAGFGYAPTPDQQAAFDAVAADLARGWPMDRLVCGDVGFGKTEVALRAAAIAALGGKQVAVLAPTTVLARQHLATFARRFAALGIAVGGLSRLTPAGEGRRVRAGLADGTLRVVVGTQALAAAAVGFADLGLVVIDEEQRFGTRHKAALTALRAGAHVLAMTATPIPRTLEGSLAGVHDLSVLTTPPARRLPVRTTVEAFDPAVMQAALLREQARGGQSFVVCPRIEDLPALAERLDHLVPDLSVVTLHGQLRPDALDAAIVGFAEGHGDVLLCTDIVEAGLDIPRANTMLVWRADRFGLAQLHQLRGRVGRGRARAAVLLTTDPDDPPTEAGAARLAALAAHDGLGAGFAIAAADLDQRGAGDLLGERQAGHVKLLGVDLARHLLCRALASVSGKVPPGKVPPGKVPPGEVPPGEVPPSEEAEDGDDAPAELVSDFPAYLPEDYIPDPALRIQLHARLARPHDPAALAEEIEDRFGPPPAPVAHLLALAELREACRRAGVSKLEAGPVAIAATLARSWTSPNGSSPECSSPERSPPNGLERRGDRLLLRRATATPDARIDAAWELLAKLASARTASAPAAGAASAPREAAAA